MLEMKITSDVDMEKTLQRLSQKAAAECADQALQVALVPCVAAMTAYAPEKTGTLKRSMGYRIKSYQRGKVIFAVAGPMRGVVGPNGEKPTKYAHLVEFGHVTKKSGKKVGAQPFMRPAWEATKEQVNDTVEREFGARIEAEVRRRRSKTAKAAGL